MSTFQERLELELDHAADRLIDGQRSHRRPSRVLWRPAVALGVTVVAVLAVRGAGTVERPAEPRVPLPTRISLLERAPTAADRRVQRLVRDQSAAGASPGFFDLRGFMRGIAISGLRVVVVRDGTTIMAASGVDGRVCAFLVTRSGSGVGCHSPWARGFGGEDNPLFDARGFTAGLLYDGVDHVTAVYRDGHTTDIAVRRNVFVLPRHERKPYPDLVAIRWDAGGGRAAQIRYDHGQIAMRRVHGRPGSAFMEFNQHTWYLLLDGKAQLRRGEKVGVYVSGPGVPRMALRHKGPSGMVEHEVDYAPPPGAEHYATATVRRGATPSGKVLFRGPIPPPPIPPASP